MVKSFVNASYLLAESDEVAQRAVRYVSYVSWRHHNRRAGSGAFSIEVRIARDTAATVAPEFAEFIGKGNGRHTVPSQLRCT
jgi:hypothetical protein